MDYSDKTWSESKRYYKHQKEVIESTKNVLVLDAPTGSGKTLAALARIIQREQSAIFVYPTNALVQDQVDAIGELLKELGRNPTIIDGTEALTQESFDLSGCDTILIHVTGVSLEVLSDGLVKGSIMDRILTGTYESNIIRIILTNPDTLFLAFAGWYQRHGRIMEHILSFQCLIIDEFHLYSGPTLARLFYIINLLRSPSHRPSMDVVYLSATHGDTLNLLQSSYSNLEMITAESFSKDHTNRRRIRGSTRCIIRTRENVLSTEKDVEEIAQAIINLYNSDYDWPKEKKLNVKVLAVVSSVIFAVRLAKKVGELVEGQGLDKSIVSQIHGLIPSRNRVRISDLTEGILIGTSAVEVGVDFDVPFLVIEAHDLASFLQRFGRGGRHSDCTSILYLPVSASSSLKEKSKWTFNKFIAKATDAFRSMPSYAKLICQPEAHSILLALALAGSRKRTAPWIHDRSFNTRDAINLLKSIQSANQEVGIDDCLFANLFDDVDTEFFEDEFDHPLVKTLAKHGFLRGTMNSVIVQMNPNLLGFDGAPFYTEMDIFDLFRLQGHLEPISSHKKLIPQVMEKRHRNVEDVFVIDSLDRSKFPKIRISHGVPRLQKTRVYDKRDYRLMIPNPQMSEIVERLLHRRNAICYTPYTSILDDYRIPRIYADGISGAVVIGDWAFVVEYLSRIRRSGDL